MATQKIIGVLSRLFGLGEPHPEPLDMHADHAEVYALRQRGMSQEQAVKETAKAVEPCKDSNEFLHCLRDAINSNDKLAAKRFLVTLASEMEREPESKSKK